MAPKGLSVCGLAACLTLQGCAGQTPKPPQTGTTGALVKTTSPVLAPQPAPWPGTETKAEQNQQNGGFLALPGWTQSSPAAALVAFRRSCKIFARHWNTAERWRPACLAAQQTGETAATVRGFFERYFVPEVHKPEDAAKGLLTAYYEPEIAVRKTPQPGFEEPVYARPPDLVTVEPKRFGDSGLRGRKIMGRVEGGRLVPYFDRAQIRHRGGKTLAWGSAADVFFLQIQGSGRLRFADGYVVRAVFAGHNGLPYTSIGRLLIKRGVLEPGKAGKAAIDAWLRAAGPEKAAELMNRNRRYVFFKAQPVNDPALGPKGTQGAPLTAMASLAVDPALVPLGSPVWIETRLPSATSDWHGAPAQFLAIAQDTGGAIAGPMRGDLYWGSGEAAGRQAGRVRQSARWWVLRPKMPPPQQGGPQS